MIKLALELINDTFNPKFSKVSIKSSWFPLAIAFDNSV